MFILFLFNFPNNKNDPKNIYHLPQSAIYYRDSKKQLADGDWWMSRAWLLCLVFVGES